MKVSECVHLTKCEFAGCSNWAKYSFATKGLIKKDLCFCEKCLKEMYELIGQMQIPKGIESPFKYGKKLRKKGGDKV